MNRNMNDYCASQGFLCAKMRDHLRYSESFAALQPQKQYFLLGNHKEIQIRDTR